MAFVESSQGESDSKPDMPVRASGVQIPPLPNEVRRERAKRLARVRDLKGLAMPSRLQIPGPEGKSLLFPAKSDLILQKILQNCKNSHWKLVLPDLFSDLLQILSFDCYRTGDIEFTPFSKKGNYRNPNLDERVLNSKRRDKRASVFF